MLGLPSASLAQLAGGVKLTAPAEVAQEGQIFEVGRMKVSVPEGWAEAPLQDDDTFPYQYRQGEGEDSPLLALSPDFGSFPAARPGLSMLMTYVQTGTPGFQVERTTDITVPGATSAVRLDFTYGTEENRGVFEAVWIVASDGASEKPQTIALAISASDLDEAAVETVVSSLQMLPAEASGDQPEKEMAEEKIAEVPAAAGAAGDNGGVVATGLYNTGEMKAEVNGLVVDGDRLTVKLALRPSEPGTRVRYSAVYTNINGNTYESVYLVSGDKKYMLVRDSSETPLAPESLTASGDGAMLATWYGVFPNPPAGQDITLYLPGFEPMGPFQVTAP